MRLTITFTVLAMCAHVPSANAGLHEESPCRFTQVTSRNGLSYNSVKCVMQDSRGYVWIGTYKGLNRYDGTRIKNYGRQDLGVKSDYINVLAEDSAGNILIGTDNGIVIYDYRKDSFRQPLQAELLDDRIYSIQNDSKGISWIGSRAQGLFSYDPETDAVSKIDLKNPEGKLVRDIYRIVIDRNDKMHVAVYCDNLYRLTGDFTMERLATSGKAGYFEKDDIEGLVLNQQPDVHSKQATWPLPAGPEDGGSQRPGNIARRFQAGISVGKRRHLVAGDIIRRGEILGGKRHLFDIEARQCRQIFVVRRLYHDGNPDSRRKPVHRNDHARY